jgi:hypothetical protein
MSDDYASLISDYEAFTSDHISLDVWIESESYEGNLEIVKTAAVKYVEMLAPGDQDAKAAILIAVQDLYWTTDIPVSEIRDAYAPGLPVSAVVTIAGPAKLNIACRRCGGSLYVTSRSSFNEVSKRLSFYDPKHSLLDICPDCRVQVTEEAVLREEALLRSEYITNPGED